MADLRKNMHNEMMETLYKDKKFFENYIPYLSDVKKMGVHKALLVCLQIKEGVLE